MSGADPAPVFAALGDATRLALLARLGDGTSRSINTLTSAGPLTRQAVTKHLHVLEQAGLVQSRRNGREVQYALRGDTLAAARDFLDGVSRQWDTALSRLKSFVESKD
jgi:DNA-binding transcriptional ArsR family regulator